MDNTREKLIKLLKECFDNGLNFEESADHLIANKVQTVVRCKDCDFACPGTYGIVCTAWGASTSPDMFCGNGERRKGE